MCARFQEILDIVHEHPDNNITVPTKRPFPIAFRNTATAWVGLTSLVVICYFKLSYFGSTVPGRVYWLAYAGCPAYSASICSLLLATEAIVSEIKEDKPEPAGAGGGMGGMY